VDPQGYSDLKWNTIERLLTHCKGDLILNFPTSGIIRNLGIPESWQALIDFFGDDTCLKLERNPDAIIEYYMQRITMAYVGSKGRAVEYLPVYDEFNHSCMT
jgi:hypothetical protein